MNRRHRGYSQGDTLLEQAHLVLFLSVYRFCSLRSPSSCFGSLAVSVQLHPAAMFGSQLVLGPCKQEWGQP